MIGEDIYKTAELLRRGEVVAIPTETVYGLAANTFDTNAVAKIFGIKNRPKFNPLIVHIKNIEYIHTIAQNINEKLIKLMTHFSPGPLTVLVEKKECISNIITAGSNKVAVRIPAHPLTLKLLNILEFPLAAPSANPFQYISPTSSIQVAEQLGDKIPYILEGGKCKVGIESTIVGIENDEIVVYRLGGIAIEEIEKYVGKVKLKTQLNKSEIVDTPGQLGKHYSPKKRMIIGDIQQILPKFQNKKIAVIIFGKNILPEQENIEVYNLSNKADDIEAAAHIFEYLYKIDASDAELIVAGLLPDIGLGRAINDRLLRAASDIHRDMDDENECF